MPIRALRDSFWVFGFCLGDPASVNSGYLARGGTVVVVVSAGDMGKVICDMQHLTCET